MNVGITELDLRHFNAVVRTLAAISGRDFETALVSQVGAVLKAAIKLTRAADRAKIINRMSKGGGYVRFADGTTIAGWRKLDVEQADGHTSYPTMFFDISTWNGRGHAPHSLSGGKSWHRIDDPNRHWSDTRWAKYQAYEAQAQAGYRDREKGRKNDLKAALAARGLAKQSWLQIAHSLGLATAALGAPGFVERATPSNGRTYRNGTAQKLTAGAAFEIEIRNDNPLLTHFTHPTGYRILELAVQSRVKAFALELEKGVFDDVAARAKRYPGVFTTG